MKRNFALERQSLSEQSRIDDLFSLIPHSGHRAIDIGARDGYLSKKLVERFEEVVALDLEKPEITWPRIQPIQGDVTHLGFRDNSFDLVLCAEVLEHIPSPALEQACAEMTRIACSAVVIGVPYKQDLRLGKTTCPACGQINPPWGHVNSFDEVKLRSLFPNLTWESTSLAGRYYGQTNFLSEMLLDFAGNPYGTYSQVETCVHCGQPLGTPPERFSLLQRVVCSVANRLNRLQAHLTAVQPQWIHVLFRKRAAY